MIARHSYSAAKRSVAVGQPGRQLFRQECLSSYGALLAGLARIAGSVA